jgi:hypothetical protein
MLYFNGQLCHSKISERSFICFLSMTGYRQKAQIVPQFSKVRLSAGDSENRKAPSQALLGLVKVITACCSGELPM